MNHDRKISHWGGLAEGRGMSGLSVFAQLCFTIHLVKETIYLS